MSCLEFDESKFSQLAEVFNFLPSGSRTCGDNRESVGIEEYLEIPDIKTSGAG